MPLAIPLAWLQLRKEPLRLVVTSIRIPWQNWAKTTPKNSLHPDDQ